MLCRESLGCWILPCLLASEGFVVLLRLFVSSVLCFFFSGRFFSIWSFSFYVAVLGVYVLNRKFSALALQAVGDRHMLNIHRWCSSVNL
ncbi:hypothetical protein P879_11942 [Paragonimus westermani]|uniref:Uncharacterized protein n=1 Tax=Paragonimus westermani TaxID=34504 RepID=A0A8T0D6D0_9TREM|nr:hypothetical protein P879_11942 [Paragonimus westermani]